MKKLLVPTIIILILAGAIFAWYILLPPKAEAVPIPSTATVPSAESGQAAPVPVIQKPAIPATTPSGIRPEYKLIKLVSSRPGAELAAAVGKANVFAVLAINRIDDAHLWKGMTVAIPVTPGNAAAYKFMPGDIASAQTIPKLIIVSQEKQSFGLYEHGHLIRSGPVSSGKEATPTKSSLYFTNWKGKEVTSTFSDEWILKWNFNIDNKDGAALHQYVLPGYPASHSCVRFYAKDAEFIYNWADQWVLARDGRTKLANGTPVIVYGKYNFKSIAPWKKLPGDPEATLITASELDELVGKNLPVISQEQTKRDQVMGHL